MSYEELRLESWPPRDSASRIALVVEDDPPLQREMARHLARMNYQVLTALDFDSAARHLVATRLDVACIDVGLPNRSGYELCEHIRSELRLEWLPILVTCDSSFPEDMANAEEAGANAFLKKPFTMDLLLKYVFALVDEQPPVSRPSVCRLRLPSEP